MSKCENGCHEDMAEVHAELVEAKAERNAAEAREIALWERIDNYADDLEQDSAGYSDSGRALALVVAKHLRELLEGQ